MMKNVGLLLASIGLVALLAMSCTKAISSKTATIGSKTAIASERQSAEKISTFIFVRHAEKESIGRNPNLTAKGTRRAEELARVLKNIPIDRVYSTNYNRTVATAQPTAKSKNLEPILYDPSNLAAFKDQVLSAVPSGTVLIVGHSNTTPDLINLFRGDTSLTHLGEKEYDHLFVLTLLGNGQSKLLQLSFGEE